MKLRFEPDLPHQAAAIAAVSDLFKGQELGRTEFTVTRTSPESAQGELGLDESALGAKVARLPEVLHGALAHPVLLLTEAADGVSLSVGLKRRHEREAGRSVLERLVASPPLPPVDADDSGVTRAFLAALPLAVQPGGDLWSVHEGWAGRCDALAAARVTGRSRRPPTRRPRRGCARRSTSTRARRRRRRACARPPPPSGA